MLPIQRGGHCSTQDCLQSFCCRPEDSCGFKKVLSTTRSLVEAKASGSQAKGKQRSYSEKATVKEFDPAPEIRC